MEAFLNELSLPKLHSENAVVDSFKEFGEYYKYARDCGIREIRVQSNFEKFEFTNGYSFYNWINDKRADQDLITLLKSAIFTVPFIDEIFNTYQQEHDNPIEIRFQGNTCFGLGLASDKIFNSIAFSFDFTNWNLPNYSVEITNISERGDGELVEETVDANAKNISAIDHVNTHQEFINKIVTNTIPNGLVLWQRREELFPNLVFCNSVESQIQNLDLNNPTFTQVIGRLFDLQNTANKFDGTPIKPTDFPTLTTPESESRRQKLKKDFTIMCPDGQARFFSWHSRYTPGAGRIHFIAFENQRLIIVGYIGQKIN